MKTDIHPDYVECNVSCGCGESFTTHAAVPEIRVEVCSKCHPFYTGKQKMVDTAGRVERFQKRWGAAIEARKAAITGNEGAAEAEQAGGESSEEAAEE